MAASIFACNHIVNCKLHCHEIEKSYLLPVRACRADRACGFGDVRLVPTTTRVSPIWPSILRRSRFRPDRPVWFAFSPEAGEYACTGNDPQIADVQLAEQTISVRGLASGSTSFAVEDTRTGQSVSVDVTVSPVPLALSYTDVAQWFAGEQPEGAGFAGGKRIWS